MLYFSIISNLKSRKFLRKIRTVSGETSQILTIHQIIKGLCAKNLYVTFLLLDFSKAFNFIHRGKMGQILLAYGFPKVTIIAIMMVYRNTKTMVCSLDGSTKFFAIVTGVLHRDTLAPHMLKICPHYALQTSIDLIKAKR